MDKQMEARLTHEAYENVSANILARVVWESMTPARKGGAVGASASEVLARLGRGSDDYKAIAKRLSVADIAKVLDKLADAGMIHCAEETRLGLRVYTSNVDWEKSQKEDKQKERWWPAGRQVWQQFQEVVAKVADSRSDRRVQAFEAKREAKEQAELAKQERARLAALAKAEKKPRRSGPSGKSGKRKVVGEQKDGGGV